MSQTKGKRDHKSRDCDRPRPGPHSGIDRTARSLNPLDFMGLSYLAFSDLGLYEMVPPKCSQIPADLTAHER